MTHVPVHIKPHLVAFFFKEMEGDEINYLNFRAKAVKLNFSSSINKFLRIALAKVDIPVRLTNLHMLLSISDWGEYQGTIYNLEDGNKYFLALPEEVNADVNELLDDVFRIAFVYYVSGHVENSEFPCVVRAINTFIEMYDLDEFGFDIAGLRRYYYREIQNHSKLQTIVKKRTKLRKG